jgi:hypothetical protein
MKIVVTVVLSIVLCGVAAGADATTQPVDVSRKTIDAAIARGVEFLEKSQTKGGYWGTGTVTRGTEIESMVPGSHDAFRLGTTALCIMALREAGEKTAHDRGVQYLIHASDARRDDGMLIYNTWAHIYVTQAMVEEMAHSSDPRLTEVAERNIRHLQEYATYLGGWSYYDFDAQTQLVSLGPTSFGTAAGLIALWEARQAGLAVPQRLVDQSLHQLEAMRLSDSAFLYGEDYKYIPLLDANLTRGAVGRTQPANLAIHLWDPDKATVAQIRAGLDAFFANHAFLEMGRKRPYPHEAWYQTSGYYYYFDHYYASRLLAELPTAERSTFAAKLAAAVLPHQEDDGSWWDYAMWDYHKPYGTAFAVMTLLRCRGW